MSRGAGDSVFSAPGQTAAITRPHDRAAIVFIFILWIYWPCASTSFRHCNRFVLRVDNGVRLLQRAVVNDAEKFLLTRNQNFGPMDTEAWGELGDDVCRLHHPNLFSPEPICPLGSGWPERFKATLPCGRNPEDWNRGPGIDDKVAGHTVDRTAKD